MYFQFIYECAQNLLFWGGGGWVECFATMHFFVHVARDKMLLFLLQWPAGLPKLQNVPILVSQ